jgi:hypothetical protein
VYEPGIYWIRIKDFRLGKSSKKETPQWVLTFQVESKVNTADPEGSAYACDQYERSIFRAITDKTIDWLKSDIAFLLEQGKIDDTFDRMDRLDSGTPGCLPLAGIICQAYCNHKTFEGNTKEEWGLGYERGRKLEIKLLESADVRKLDSMFGKQLRGSRAPKSAPTVQPAPAPEIGPQSSYTDADVAAVENDPDVPF